MKGTIKNQSGFTLIEMLIVIIILGILAMVIIPQISVSTSDAKLSTLQTNLAILRNAVELYYHQHDGKYPGAMDTSGAATTDATTAQTAFVSQLTLYSAANGATADTKAPPTTIHGPYIKGVALPTNPFNNKNDVICDPGEDNITVRDSSGDDFGWKFYPKTGVLIPADAGAHDTL